MKLYTLPKKFDSRSAIIFLHGYYGSALKSKTKRKPYFVNPQSVLFGKYSVQLFQKELDLPPVPELECAGLLGSVPAIPGVYNIQVYSPMIEFLNSHFPERQIIPMPYDWRSDLVESVQKLDQLIKTLKAQGVDSISVVGHSMGGYLLAYYLRYGIQDPIAAVENWSGRKFVNKSVFIGSPFRGSTAIFKNMVRGVSFYFNKRLLPKEAVASFPSSYYLLPWHHQEIYDPKIWPERNIGLFNGTESGTTKKKRFAFTTKYLKRAESFQNAILAPAIAKDPGSSLNVIGVGRDSHGSYHYYKKTNHYAFFPKEVKEKDLRINIIAEGDEAVSVASAKIPPAYKSSAKEIQTSFAHALLFCDPKVQEALCKFL